MGAPSAGHVCAPEPCCEPSEMEKHNLPNAVSFFPRDLIRNFNQETIHCFLVVLSFLYITSYVFFFFKNIKSNICLGTNGCILNNNLLEKVSILPA